MTVSPANPTIMVGATQQFTAQLMLSDGTTRAPAASDNLTWASSTAATATIDAMSGLATGVARGTTTITATVGTFSGNTQLNVQAVHTLDMIQITPAMATIRVGQMQQFTAIGHYADGMTSDVTSMATWSSSTPATATINGSGNATGVAAGTTMVRATIGTIMSNAATLTVGNPMVVSIALTPVTATLRAGATMGTAITATATLDNGMTQNITEQMGINWSSSAPMIAAVSNTAGMRGTVTPSATMAGTANITASYMGVTSSPAVITVLPSAIIRSIAVTPATATVAAGMDQAFTATATYEDGRTGDVTTMATWSSSAATVATINAMSGLAHGVAAGMATITASVPNGATPSMNVTATAALTVSPGVLMAIQVAPSATSIAVGNSTTFTATGLYTDMTSRPLTTGVSWSTTMPSIATISATGVAMGATAGTVTVRAQVGTVTGTASLVVTPAVIRSISITPTNPTIPVGGMQQLTAQATFSDGTTQNITSSASWSTAMGSVATVSSGGLVNGVSAGGPVTITASAGGIMGTTNVTVSGALLTRVEVTPNPAPSLPVGLTRQFTATGFYTVGAPRDLTNDPALRWDSSVLATASISNAMGSRGLAQGAAAGVTQITAAFTYTPPGMTMPVTITSSPVALQVTAAALQTIDVAPTVASVPRGFTVRFTATGHFSDGNSVDLTGDPTLTWSTADSAVATVSNAPGSKGVVTGAAVTATSTTTVRATVGSGMTAVTGSAALTVTAATLASMTITPNPFVITIGQPGVVLTVNGRFSDGTNRDVTADVTFTSGSPANVQITRGTDGSATASATTAATPQPSVTISAQVGSVTASATGTVQTTSRLVGINVRIPANNVIPVGFTTSAIADGIFDNGLTRTIQDITTQVIWSSNDNTVARVDNATGSQGLVTGLAVSANSIQNPSGGVLITASLTPMGGTMVSGSAQVFVTNCMIDSLVLTSNTTPGTPVNTANLPLGGAQALHTYGHLAPAGGCSLGGAPSNPSFYEITDRTDVSYVSANTAVATVSNSSPRGVITVSSNTSAVGMSTSITARYGTLPAATFTVNANGACVDMFSIVGGNMITLPRIVTGASSGVTAQRQLQVTAHLTNGTTVASVAAADMTFATTGSSVPVPVTSAGLVGGNTASAGTTNFTVHIGGGSLTQCTTPATADITGTVTAQNDTLTALTITPNPPPDLPVNQTVPLRANGTFMIQGGPIDITSIVAWSASGTAASVAPTGVVTGLAIGTSTVTATLSTLSASTTVRVTAATVTSVTVLFDRIRNPLLCDAVTIAANGRSATAWPIGVRIPIYVDALRSDGVTHDNPTTVTSVVSSDTAVVSVPDPTQLFVIAQGPGSATITVTYSGVSSNASSGSLPIDVATATASVPTAILMGPAAGTTFALGSTVQFGSVAQYGAFFPVGAPVTGRVCEVTSQTVFTASPTSRITFSGAVASVTNMSANAGPVAVTGTFRAVAGTQMYLVSGAAQCTASIAVSPATISTAAGLNATVTVIPTFGDGSTGAAVAPSSWASSASTVADVTSSGTTSVIQARSMGMATLTASYIPPGAAPRCSGTGALTATTVVTVGNETLTALDIGCGTAVDAATTGTGLAPAGISANCRVSGTFSAGVSPRDLTTDTGTTWSSSNPAVATVDNGSNKGTITTVGPGTVVITATNTINGMVSGSYVLTVNRGALTSVTIQPYTTGAAASALYLPSVAARPSISVDQRSSLPVGLSSLYQAVATFVDNTGSTTWTRSYDVTQAATWASSSSGVASVSTTGNNRGTVSAVAAGMTNLTATYNGRTSANSAFTTTTDVLVAIQINATGTNTFATNVGVPVNATALGQYCPMGTPVFTGSGTAYCGGSPPSGYPLALDITSQAAWSTSDPLIVTVTSSGNPRQITGVAPTPGTTTARVFAVRDGLTGTATGTVGSACIQSLSLTARNTLSTNLSALPIGAQVTYVLNAIYSGSSTPVPITQAGIATYSNTLSTVIGSPSVGTATVNAQAAGTTNVSASAAGCSGTVSTPTPVTITVVNTAPTALQVLPPNVTIAAGTSQTYRVYGTFGTAGQYEISGWSSILYTSSNTMVADNTPSGSSSPTFRAGTAGTTVISASVGTISGSTNLTATAATPAGIEIRGVVVETTPPAQPCPGSSTTTTSDVTPWNVPAGAVVRALAFQSFTDSTPATEVASTLNWSVVSGSATILGPGIIRVGDTATGTIVIRAAHPTLALSDDITITVVSNAYTTVDIRSTAGASIPSASLALASDFESRLVGALGSGASAREYCLTETGAWSSANNAIANVGTGTVAAGTIHGNALGATVITATLGTFTDTLNVSVTSATLQYTYLAPTAGLTLMRGANGQVTMLAHFSDGTEQDVTRTIGNSYASSNTTIATIDTLGVVRNPPAPGGASGMATLCGCYTPMGGGTTCTNGTGTCSPIGTGRNISVTVSP